jgi:alpha-D-ribose 1-methylphosphonate 5-triphosphate synthase subunit PhnG
MMISIDNWLSLHVAKMMQENRVIENWRKAQKCCRELRERHTAQERVRFFFGRSEIWEQKKA